MTSVHKRITETVAVATNGGKFSAPALASGFGRVDISYADLRELLDQHAELRRALADGVGGMRCVCHSGIHGDWCWPCVARAAIRRARGIKTKEGKS